MSIPIAAVRSCRVGAVLFVLAVAACGGRPTAPSQTPSETPTGTQQPPLRVVADPVVDMTRGETRALPVEERDASGGLVTRAATAYAWSSSDPAVVSVDADGALCALAEFGTAVITVRSPAGLTASVRAWVQLPEGVPSSYHITLIFSEDVLDDWRPGFEWAA